MIKSVGARVTSNPIKNNRRSVVVKVTIRARRIIIIRDRKWRVSFGDLFLRCPILAIADTGISQRLSIRRGVLSSSFRSPRDRFAVVVFGFTSSRVPSIRRMEVLDMVRGHRIFVGAIQSVVSTPRVVVMMVNILFSSL